MTAWDFMKDLHTICHFMSKEGKGGEASNSELKRWLQNQAVELNSRRIKWDEDVDFPVESLVLFPKKCRTTIY